MSQQKARCLMELSMKARSLLSKIGMVLTMNQLTVDFDP